MIFSVVKSSDPQDHFAPFQILIDGDPFLDGIELECEAHSICRLLVDLEADPPAPIKPKHPSAGKFRKIFRPRLIETSKLEATRKFLRDERGSVLLEFAIITPILLLLVLGGLDLVRLANAKSDVDWIATSLATCTKEKSCTGTAQSLAQGLGLDPSAISSNGGSVAYTWKSVSPFFPATVTLTTTAIAP